MKMRIFQPLTLVMNMRDDSTSYAGGGPENTGEQALCKPSPINARFHLMALACAALLLYLPTDSALASFSLEFFPALFIHYGLVGLLHSLALSIAIYPRSSLKNYLVFIALTFVMAALAPIIFLLLDQFLSSSGLTFFIAIGGSSAIPAYLYGWLIRKLFWKQLSYHTLGWVSGICGITSFLSFLLTTTSIGFGHLPTIVWWFAFSCSLIYLGVDDRVDGVQSKSPSF